MIYNPISANTLFHYTKSLDILESILTNEFYPRYCLEDHSMFRLNDTTDYLSERAVPMVCFCDIPLSNIRKHADQYGNYAIGLSKEWGMRKGISPVLYTYKNSISAGHFRNAYNECINRISSTIDLKKSIQPDFSTIFLELFILMTKPYEGTLTRKDGTVRNIRFYDEREWRYVPSFEDILKYQIMATMPKDKYENKAMLDENNSKLEILNLSFDPNDIKYIILNNEAEIPEFINKLKRIKAKYTNNAVDLLITRIISMEQIVNDF